MRIFIAVIESVSLSAASEMLEQTTSGISRALARLEEKRGASLRMHPTRRMQLTEEGRLFLGQACDIIAAMERAGEVICIRQCCC